MEHCKIAISSSRSVTGTRILSKMFRVLGVFRGVPVFRVPVFLEVLHACFSKDNKSFKTVSLMERKRFQKNTQFSFWWKAKSSSY